MDLMLKSNSFGEESIMAYYKNPDEMFTHRVEVSIKLYEKYLNK